MTIKKSLQIKSKNALREDTILVSTMYVNNETGTLLPIAEIGQILKVHSAAYHVDAVQAVGKLKILPGRTRNRFPQCFCS